jgi:hypothetical protein
VDCFIKALGKVRPSGMKVALHPGTPLHTWSGDDAALLLHFTEWSAASSPQKLGDITGEAAG